MTSELGKHSGIMLSFLFLNIYQIWTLYPNLDTIVGIIIYMLIILIYKVAPSSEV